MRPVDAYADLQRFGNPVVTTEDAALRLRTSLSAASRILARLAKSGLIRRLRRGLWSLRPDLDPLLVPEYLTAPLPAYVSLQSALSFHGMIDQIPHVVYAASLALTRRVSTSLGTYSIHRLVPEFFGGFTTDRRSGVKMATPEKALLDPLYLSPARSRLFAKLPELELPRRFRVGEARRWIARIPAQYRRTMVTRRFEELLDRLPLGAERPVQT